MSIFNQFPWTNFREYNLDWVIRTVQDALENIYDTATQIYADHIDATLSIQGDAADAKKTGDEINSLKGRMTTAEGKITTLEGYDYHQVIIRQLSLGNWSYGKGDFDEADKVLSGIVGANPTLDNVGSIWYQPTLSSPARAMVSCNINTSYFPITAWDLEFYAGSGTEVSVTIKSDGTFV